MIAAALVLIGLGAAGLHYKTFTAWLAADWSRGVAVGLLILLIAGLLALYGTAVKRDEPLAIEAVPNTWEHFAKIWPSDEPRMQNLASQLG